MNAPTTTEPAGRRATAMDRSTCGDEGARNSLWSPASPAGVLVRVCGRDREIASASVSGAAATSVQARTGPSVQAGRPSAYLAHLGPVRSNCVEARAQEEVWRAYHGPYEIRKKKEEKNYQEFILMKSGSNLPSLSLLFRFDPCLQNGDPGPDEKTEILK
jgi:hypothetical protein